MSTRTPGGIGAGRCLLAIAVLAGLLVITTGCGGGQSGTGGAGRGAVEIPAGAQRLSVTLSEFAIEPADLTAEAGRPIAVTVVNAGSIEHDWTVHLPDGSEVAGGHIVAAPGTESTGVFTLEPGTYEVWCAVPGHQDAGMTGTLTAE